MPGVEVPTPTLPPAVITKDVEVALAEVEATAKRGRFESEEVAWIETRAQGEVEEKPVCPRELMKSAVEVAMFWVELAAVTIASRGIVESEEVALRVSTAKGEVVPIPTLVAPAV